MSLYSEISEQPSCLERLLRNERGTVERIARAVARRNIRSVYVAARGTSENAGRYATYVWGAMNRLPVALAAPSLFTYYDSPPKLDGAFVVGISQSGRSPDIVSVISEANRQNCLTLAITNEVDSPLAKCADFVFDICAEKESAVAATKTYTTQLMAVAMLSAAMQQRAIAWQELNRVPELLQELLKSNVDYAAAVQPYMPVSRCVVLGRGYNYATAFEWALKLKELTYMEAQPYSSADFLHGPIAAVDGAFPIFAVAPDGAVTDSLLQVLRRMLKEQLVDLVVISNLLDALKLGQTSLPLPCDIPEWISPILSIVPAQLFCYHLALAKGCNPDSPRGIHKVTETR